MLRALSSTHLVKLHSQKSGSNAGLANARRSHIVELSIC